MLGATDIALQVPLVSGTTLKTVNGISLLGSGNLAVTASWVVKTANYQLVAGDAVLANTTSGVLTFTLPASAVANQVISVADYSGTLATNKLVIARNGHNINTLAQDMDVNTKWARFDLVYIDTTVGWRTL